MVPADSTGVPLAPTYSGYPYRSSSLPVRDYHPLRLTFPGYSSFDHKQTAGSYNPHLAVTTWVWANPRSLATTCGITIVFSSSGYLDVSVPRVRLPCGISGLQPDGLPHSDIFGSTAMCASPKLFAAYHVLLRL